MYITDNQLDSLQFAIDFIGNNADGADDAERYEKIMDDLRKIWKKGIKEFVYRQGRNKKSKKKLIY